MLGFGNNDLEALRIKRDDLNAEIGAIYASCDKLEAKIQELKAHGAPTPHTSREISQKEAQLQAMQAEAARKAAPLEQKRQAIQAQIDGVDGGKSRDQGARRMPGRSAAMPIAQGAAHLGVAGAAMSYSGLGAGALMTAGTAGALIAGGQYIHNRGARQGGLAGAAMQVGGRSIQIGTAAGVGIAMAGGSAMGGGMAVALGYTGFVVGKKLLGSRYSKAIWNTTGKHLLEFYAFLGNLFNDGMNPDGPDMLASGIARVASGGGDAQEGVLAQLEARDAQRRQVEATQELVAALKEKRDGLAPA